MEVQEGQRCLWAVTFTQDKLEQLVASDISTEPTSSLLVWVVTRGLKSVRVQEDPRVSGWSVARPT